MQIAVALHAVRAGEIAGVYTYLRELAFALPREASGGRPTFCGFSHTVEALGLSGERDRLATSNMPFTPRGRATLALAAAASATQMWRQITRHCNIVHYPATIPLPHSDRPHVVTVHDVQHLDRPEFFSRSQRAWRRIAYDAPARSASTVITISKHAKARIVHHLGIPAERVHVVYHGLDHLRPVRALVQEEHMLPSRDSFFLYPAALWPHKNHAALLSAMTLLPPDFPSLLLTGPPVGREHELHGLIQNLRLQSRVKYLGFVPRRVLGTLYSRARAVIFPSKYEGFGFPPLEAMVARRPVAVSATASLPELCGDAALYFDPDSPEEIAERMRTLHEDDTVRRTLIQAGAQRVTSFTWRATARGHWAAYRAALADESS